MELDKLKEELSQFIQATEDADLLAFLRDDIDFYKTAKEVDIVDSLTGEQVKELSRLVNEPVEKDAIGEEEFNEITKRWRIG